MSGYEKPRRREVLARPASAVTREQIEYLIPGRVPFGMVTVLSGIGGLGKSTLTCQWAAENPGVSLIATAEDSLAATVRPRLEAAGADLERVRLRARPHRGGDRGRHRDPRRRGVARGARRPTWPRRSSSSTRS